MPNFYVPSTKVELVRILVAAWPIQKASLNKMDKKQLYAMFYQLRKDQLK